MISFQNKLVSLKFPDSACGSGNFLTEIYLSLRRFETEVLKHIIGTEIKLCDIDNPIKVSINSKVSKLTNCSVVVAKTALWIVESQMITENSKIIHKNLDLLLLKNSVTIVESNTLKIYW